MARRTSGTGDVVAHSVSPTDLPGYMFSAECFDASHLGELKELEAAIREHMSRVYGIGEVAESDMFFHGFEKEGSERPFFNTAHFHIVHKRPRRFGCFMNAITLSDVINHITATGQSFEQPPMQARPRVFNDELSSSSSFVDALGTHALSAGQRLKALAGGHVLQTLDLIRISDNGDAVAGSAHSER